MKLSTRMTRDELQAFGTYFSTAFRCALDLELFSTSNYTKYYNLRTLHKKLIDRHFSETPKVTLKICVNQYESLKWLRDETHSRIKMSVYHVAVARGIFDTFHQQELKLSHRTNFIKLVE